MASPTADPPVPDEILEDIFLRLDDAADLACASAACTAFRRLVSARRFLRRFRSLHRPPILGCLASEFAQFHPVDPPHRSSAASAALAQAADFTFSFINPRNQLDVRDVRDGRVLLSTSYYAPDPFEYLVVCDPLHRRYATVPEIPGNLLPSSRRRGLCPTGFEAFLDAVSEKEEEHLLFRVICNVMYQSKIVTLVFSSVTRIWQPATSFSHKYAPFARHYAHNCFFWTHCANKDMLVLDRREMKFSVVNLPPRIHQGSNDEWAVVDAGEDKLGLLALGSDKCSLELYLRNVRSNSVGTEDWHHDKTIPLPNNCHWSVCSVCEGCLILHGVERDWYKMPKCSGVLPHVPHRQYFVVDHKTSLVERLCVFQSVSHKVFPYSNFLPPLSLPTI